MSQMKNRPLTSDEMKVVISDDFYKQAIKCLGHVPTNEELIDFFLSTQEVDLEEDPNQLSLNL